MNDSTVPGFWCPACAIGWREHAMPNCLTPLDHFHEWISSPRPPLQPSHSLTKADRDGA